MGQKFSDFSEHGNAMAGWPGATDPVVRMDEMGRDNMATDRIFPLGGDLRGGLDAERRDRPQQIMQTSVGHFNDPSSAGKASSDFSVSLLSSTSQLIRLPRRFDSQSCESATMSLVTWIRRASSLPSSKFAAFGP